VASLPPDYLERAYAAVLGKLIGVYLGRPFENWTYERILRELGPIEGYVHERLGVPLVVTDDDVAGTFIFARALEDHGARRDLSAREIGETWLNYIVEHRSILWWGGNGTSTEHTAWLNLKNGVPAPESGSIAANGRAVAEQIGAQIFIDGWAIAAPGDPDLAARLAGEAGRVSHDGAAVHAAQLWAAMEAEAFVCDDVERLLEAGLARIPSSSAIAAMIADIRRWRALHADWRDTRAEIAAHYGYDKYPGHCHVMPNHALMIMAILYAPRDFSLAQTIVCTSGWDTDCNAGNVGCLMGAMLGLDGLSTGVDWRGPVADRMLLSSADGGNAINDAVRVTYRLVNCGRALAGAPPLPPPKGGAPFHFSLPGSVQGFAAQGAGEAALTLDNGAFEQGRALWLRYAKLGAEPVAALTPTFASPDVVRMRTYDLMATPLLYSGQTVVARIVAAPANAGPVSARLRALIYGGGDALSPFDGDPVRLQPGAEAVLRWRLPDTGGQPIQSIGVALASEDREAEGAVALDYLKWEGAPELRLRRPDAPSDFWRRAWVNSASEFHTQFPLPFRISQDRGEGMIIHGGSDWTDLRIETTLKVHLAQSAGLGLRVQGLRRYLAVLLQRRGVLQIVRRHDGETAILAEAPFDWLFEVAYPLAVEIAGDRVTAEAGGVRLEARDAVAPLKTGGMALIVESGSCSCDEFRVGAQLAQRH
jgi:ADP-ribosylglycohydrolase